MERHKNHRKFSKQNKTGIFAEQSLNMMIFIYIYVYVFRYFFVLIEYETKCCLSLLLHGDWCALV